MQHFKMLIGHYNRKAALACYIPHFSFADTFITSNLAYKKYHGTEILLTRTTSDIDISMDSQEINISTFTARSE